MFFKRDVLLKLFISFGIVICFASRSMRSDATQVVNVRKTHKLQSRSLLFPPTAPTRVQFIGGIGIPVEHLHFESVTSGYVFKAEYFLPETADAFRQELKPQRIHRRRKSLNETDIYMGHSLLNKEPNRNFSSGTLNVSQNMQYSAHDLFKNQQQAGDLYRWIIYKAVETVLNKSALNGHVCMLRSICEHAAIPLTFEAGLLAEILHIILTPSTSSDKLVQQDHKDYIEAEWVGRSGADCQRAFSECIKSPMDLITAVFEI